MEGIAEALELAGECLAQPVVERHHHAFIDTYGSGYVELALALGVATERIDTIADYAAAAKYGVKTDGGSEAGPGAEILAELARLIADGQLELPIAKSYPLTQVREAYAELERRHTRGKIVLTP